MPLTNDYAILLVTSCVGRQLHFYMLKIGIDYTAAVHQSAGIGRYTREMVNALAAVSLMDSTYHYRLFVAEASKIVPPTLPGPNWQWCPTGLSKRWLERLWYRLRLPLWVEGWTGRIALFHAPDFVLPAVMPGTRTIVTIHDLSFVREPNSTMPGMAAHLNRWVPRSVQQADHVIAVSESTRQDLIALYHTPPEKISVLYHGVTPHFQPTENPTRLHEVRQRYGLGERPFILTVGTIQPRKNYQRLIQAYTIVLQKLFIVSKNNHLGLVIVGSKGWQYEAIFNEVSRLGLENQVHFLGFVDETDLPTLYSAATLFAYPALYEGFGLPVLEAMACGTPVMASNLSALPEVVGQAGLLVNPRQVEAMAEAMLQLLTNMPLRQQLIQAGFKQAAKFTWPKMAEQLLALYKANIF